MVAPAKQSPRRTLRILGNPIAGVARAALTCGRRTAEYLFCRRPDGTVSVRRDGAEYTCDPAAGTCTCPAGKWQRVEECRHVAASRTLAARGHL